MKAETLKIVSMTENDIDRTTEVEIETEDDLMKEIKTELTGPTTSRTGEIEARAEIGILVNEVLWERVLKKARPLWFRVPSPRRDRMLAT